MWVSVGQCGEEGVQVTVNNGTTIAAARGGRCVGLCRSMWGGRCSGHCVQRHHHNSSQGRQVCGSL